VSERTLRKLAAAYFMLLACAAIVVMAEAALDLEVITVGAAGFGAGLCAVCGYAMWRSLGGRRRVE
jgi:hypothetical protein